MNNKDIAMKIASYVKQGWKLTSLSCPICGSPLVSKNDKYFCPNCGKKVMVAKDEEEAWKLIKVDITMQLEKRIIEKIKITIDNNIIDNPETLDKLKDYLDILKKIKDLKD